MEHTALYQIMVRNGGKFKFPLWKLHVQEQEYNDLKETLSAAYFRGNLDSYTREAALFYAEWWRREYDGGFPSKERVARAVGIDDSELLFKLAK